MGDVTIRALVDFDEIVEGVRRRPGPGQQAREEVEPGYRFSRNAARHEALHVGEPPGFPIARGRCRRNRDARNDSTRLPLSVLTPFGCAPITVLDGL